MRITYILIIIILAWYANGLRIDNIEKNRQLECLKSQQCVWNDFNKSFMLETALPRLPEIEAIYKERQ